MSRQPRLLEVAIERREWELAALCLLNGLARAAEKLPPEAIEELLDLLAAIDEPHPAKRRRRRRDGYGR
jgi:hypothetical protein